jgi:hypothetical protein
MFLIGALPAFLCVFLQMRLKEPEKWVQGARGRGGPGSQFGSYASLFGEARWRTAALLGMLLCVAGVIGLWGIGFFAPELVGPVIERSLREQNLPPNRSPAQRSIWIGINSIVFNIGAFVGMIADDPDGAEVRTAPGLRHGVRGRDGGDHRVLPVLQRQGGHLDERVMGACQLALFAGFAIYLPGAVSPAPAQHGHQLLLQRGTVPGGQRALHPGKTSGRPEGGGHFAGGEDRGVPQRRDLDERMIFLVGLIALIFLPETKGRPCRRTDRGRLFATIGRSGPPIARGGARIQRTRSWRLLILPTLVLGKLGTISDLGQDGALVDHAAVDEAVEEMHQLPLGVTPGRDWSSCTTTSAWGRSSHLKSGFPTTATSLDRRVLAQGVFQFERRDPLAADLDDVLESIRDADVAVIVLVRDVAGVQPSGAPEFLWTPGGRGSTAGEPGGPQGPVPHVVGATGQRRSIGIDESRSGPAAAEPGSGQDVESARVRRCILGFSWSQWPRSGRFRTCRTPP